MRGSVSEFLIVAIVAGVVILFMGAKRLPELARAWKESRDIIKGDGGDGRKAIEAAPDDAKA